MDKVQVGWREWVRLPDLGIDAIKAKVDTGARTSALHAFELEEFEKDGRQWVRFALHPLQDNQELIRQCECQVIDKRMVTDSGGHREERFVIQTLIDLGERQWPIEMTLTNRENMKFRMLLGRTAMRHIIVDPSESFLLGGDTEKP